jgi:hypothetical protein
MQTAGLVLGIVTSLLGVLLYWPFGSFRWRAEEEEQEPEAGAEAESA